MINVFVAFCFDSRAQQFFFGDVQELFFFTGAMVDARPLIMQPSFYDYHEGVHEALKKPGVPHRLDWGLSDFPVDILISRDCDEEDY